MQRLGRCGAVLAFAIALSGCALPGSLATVSKLSDDAPDPRYPIARHVRYGFTAHNTRLQPLEKAELWVYAPVRLTSTQRLARLSASHPYRLLSDELGNQILHFELGDFPPLASKVISIQADLYVSERPNAVPRGDARDVLSPARYVESDAPEIVRLAGSLRRASTLESARAGYEWVASNLRSEVYIPDDRGALYALRNGVGDCTEFMDLFVALSRANGIPARGLGGYVLSENAILKAVDYHNWAEFYLDGAWHVADAQRRAFMQRSAQYVALRVIAASSAGPLGNSHRFHYSGEGLKVGMN
jgi:transglutaminase-like putative cysteine protease